MLYITAELPKPKRIQGTFVGEKEIKRVVDFIKEQSGSVIYNDQVVEKPVRDFTIPGLEHSGDDDDDELMAEALNCPKCWQGISIFITKKIKSGLCACGQASGFDGRQRTDRSWRGSQAQEKFMVARVPQMLLKKKSLKNRSTAITKNKDK